MSYETVKERYIKPTNLEQYPDMRGRSGHTEPVLLQKSLQAAMRGFAAVVSVAQGVS